MFRPQSVLILALLSEPAAALLTGPYTADPHTAHLFHLDEASGAETTANSGMAARPLLAFEGAAAPANNTSPQPPSAAILGAAGPAPGFGNAAHLATASLGLGLDGNGNGAFQPGTTAGPDAVTQASLAGPDGSFTLEALVNLPAITGANRQILSTDSSHAERGFQFRVATSGQLEFNFIAGSGTLVVAPIPTSGPHAFVAGEWFHAAVSHHGPTRTTVVYWTRLHDLSEAANPLATSTAEVTVGTVTGPLVIGNEGRAASGEGLRGFIDEVRISTIVRGVHEFLFAAPDYSIDEDRDGLPDHWELLHFGHLDTGPDDDPDRDGVSNLEEFAAGSLPNTTASVPGDSDGDALPDDWEHRYFGQLGHGPAGDPDGDGEDNATELANGSAPNNRSSTSQDTDDDGLPDDWELAHFGSLDSNGGADPDGDGFSNIQEHGAGTMPGDPGSRPAGTAVKLVPLDDGDHSTSEFGFAGASAINTIAFNRASLKTVGNQQFVTWYGRHRLDPGAPFNNTLWIGRRILGSAHWEVFRHPFYTANNINDGHDVISFGIDGEGYMHLSWGMHGDDFHYARSLEPVTGDAPIMLGPEGMMAGHETTVTYPQFLTLPDGDLLYLFRRFWSGNGAQFLNRYSTATRTWSAVHTNGSGTAVPFLSGMWAPQYDYNPYGNMPCLGGPGGDELVLLFNWRYLPTNGPGAPGSPGGFSGYQTNNRLNFARSPDAGLTWRRTDGTAYSLPITRNGEAGDNTSAEVILDIPEGSSLINQAGMCLDAAGNPVAATWWAPETAQGNYRRQYMVVFRHADGTWQTRPVSNRTIDPPGTRFSESFVRDLGRPIVVVDDDDRIIVAYRDNQGANGLTVVHSLPRAQDPDRLLWIEFDLTTDNLGNYEPVIDNELWDRDRQLHFIHQPSQGQGFAPAANSAARFSVLEWDATAYFTHQPAPSITRHGDSVRITCPSQPSWHYRLWTATRLDDWSEVETRPGTGGELVFIQPWDPAEPARFWRIGFREGGF